MTPVRWICVVLGGALAGAAGAWIWHQVQRSSPPSPPEPWFADVTELTGLDFVHDAGPSGAYFMPQIMGSGAALFDFDGDGRLDIYLLNMGGPAGQPNRLFQQQDNGGFQNVSAGSGLDIAGYNIGVAIGDVDNDGRPDVLVTQYGGVKLFHNDGKGRFHDITEEAGLVNPRWGASAAFIDFDRDGWLDLVVVNYVVYDPSVPCRMSGGRLDFCTPKTFPGSPTRLYRNRGKEGSPGKVRFQDVTARSGLNLVPGPGLGVLCADFDGDGWADIFVANDGEPNRLWMNRHDGTFREEALLRGIACSCLGQPEANMGVALGDVDGDGRFDLFVTHLKTEMHTLWKQGPAGLFRDDTAASGLSMPRGRGTGFGTVLADFDLDGWLDAAIVNGHVARPAGVADGASPWAPYADRNQVLVNNGGCFTDRSQLDPALCGQAAVWRGLAWGDVDGDGRLDLLATCVAGRARLFRNVAPRQGHWLLVEAVDPAHGGRPAYGAEVRAHAGQRSWLAWINPGSSYLCSNDPRAHFGLGTHSSVEAIEIHWPDGSAEVFPGTDADRQVKLVKGKGRNQRRERDQP